MKAIVGCTMAAAGDVDAVGLYEAVASCSEELPMLFVAVRGRSTDFRYRDGHT